MVICGCCRSLRPLINGSVHQFNRLGDKYLYELCDNTHKAHQRWLWHAVDHGSGDILAYVFGDRSDAVFLELKAWLAPFGITRFYTDGLSAYERHLPPEQHVVSKTHIQKIERKHLTLRTQIKRLVRKTICFSKLEKMHGSRDRPFYQSV